MNASIRARLAALEARARPLFGGIVRCQPGESPEAAAIRAGRGAVIVLPAAMPPEAWEREVARNQMRLLQRAESVANGQPDPGDTVLGIPPGGITN